MATMPPPFRMRALGWQIARRVRAALPGRRTTYVSERVDEYRGYWAEAASLVGARFEELLPGVWSVQRDGRRTVLANYVTECDDPIVLHLAGDKPYGYRLAMEAGVPVPDHCVFTLPRFSEAVSFLECSDGPLVVKPAAGTSSGLGVSLGVRTKSDLKSAAALAALYADRLIVERTVVGESYRILFLDGCAIHAVRRRGVRITGDGRPIADLLRAAGLGSLAAESVVRETLAAQGLTIESAPPAGAELLVRGLAPANSRRELRTIYDESVLDRCSPELLRECAAVVRALGSELAGVDVITADPSVSLRKSGGAFIEINTTPGIHHHYLGGASDRGAPVGATVLEYLLTREAGC